MQFNVSTSTQDRLAERMLALRLREEDLVEHFIKGSGPGGQKINKTSSCVYLLHKPTGMEIKCQHARSQAMNRFLARRELCDRIEEKTLGEKSRRQQEVSRIRRQKNRRTRRQKEKMLRAKHIHSDKKSLRRSVRNDD